MVLISDNAIPKIYKMVNLLVILNLKNEATLISYFSFSPHGKYVLFLPLSLSSSEIEF